MKPCQEQMSMFSAEASRDCASLSVSPEAEKEREMTVISGRKCSELSKKSGPLGLLVKMLLESSAWGSPHRNLEWKAENLTASRVLTTTTEYFHDIKKCFSMKSSKTCVTSVTKSRHLLFRLVPQKLRTNECECSLLPTVMATVATHGGPNQRNSRGRPGLQAAAQLWPTPKSCGNRNSRNAIIGKNTEGKHKSDMGLEQAVEVANGFLPRELSAVDELPPRFQKMFPTPAAQDAKNATLPPSQINRDTIPGLMLRDGKSVQLNPNWVDWLMGLPPGWTDIDSEMPLPKHNPNWFDAEPPIPRVASNIKNRVPRLTLDGNGVVPQQAYQFFDAIAQIEGGQR